MPRESQRRQSGTQAGECASALCDTIIWRSGLQLQPYPRTLAALVASLVAEHADQVVLIDAGRSCTWRDLDAWSARLAGRLADRVPPGGRIAILAHNSLEHLLGELAAWKLAAIAVPVFTGFPAPRLREMLAQVEPAVALLDDAALAACVPAGCEVLATDRLLEMCRQPGREALRQADEHTPCLIQFTSGSTGHPRGVVLTQGNLCRQQAAFAMLWPEIGPGDRLAAYLPWHHSFGALAERMWSLSRGACLTVVPGGGRKRDLFIQTVRTVRPTVFMSVPKIHALAMEAALFGDGALRWAFTAGAPLAAQVSAWYRQSRIPVYEGWGLTEASPSCTITLPGSPRVPGVVGQPIPGVSVGVRASDGRLFVRGPNVMRGYYGQETPCLRDGQLDTGDLGAWTEAGLQLTGRADHQLKLANGEKVSAADLEAALHGHPAIQHAVVAVDGALLAVIEARAGVPARMVLQAVREVNQKQSAAWQRLTEVYLLHEPMQIDNGLLTASMKVSRGRVLALLRAWRSEGGAQLERLALPR